MAVRFSPEPQQIALCLPEKGVYVQLLDETNAERAMREPEEFRDGARPSLTCQDGRLLLDLLSYAVARID